MGESNDLKASDSQFNESLNLLRELLTNQLHDIRQLTDIADGIIKEQHLSKSAEPLKGYENQINYVKKQQNVRLGTIDRLINEHILAVKKGKASNEQIFALGKEVRKTEAGIRTVMLFLNDAMNMLNPELNLVNRIDDRIQYYYKRSTELENEIAFIQAKLNGFPLSSLGSNLSVL